jgi:ABC-type transport system involved in cytochrome c biogenesis permease component
VDWKLFKFNLRIMQTGILRTPVILAMIIFMLMFANYRLKPDVLEHFMASLLLIIPAFLLVHDFQHYLTEDIRNGFLERYLSQPHVDGVLYISSKFLSYIVQVVLPFASIAGIYALFQSGLTEYTTIVASVFFMGLGFVAMSINFCALQSRSETGIIGYILIPLQMPSYLMFIAAIERQSCLNSQFAIAVGLIAISVGVSILLFQRVVRDIF